MPGAMHGLVMLIVKHREESPKSLFLSFMQATVNILLVASFDLWEETCWGEA